MRVFIDGTEYVPKGDLGEAYSIAFCYGSYDPDTRPEHLRKIWDLLHTVNQELHFKE